MEKAKKHATGMVNIEPHTTIESVAPAKAPEEPVANTTLVNNFEREQDLSTLKEELATRKALRDKEREQKKAVKEEKRRVEDALWKNQANNDRMKQEHEKLLQEKDKLRRSVEAEIERLKEELC